VQSDCDEQNDVETVLERCIKIGGASHGASH
jgi:hypothetical protein